MARSSDLAILVHLISDEQLGPQALVSSQLFASPNFDFLIFSWLTDFSLRPIGPTPPV